MEKISSILLALLLFAACSDEPQKDPNPNAQNNASASQSAEPSFNKLVKFELSLLDGSQLGLSRVDLNDKNLQFSQPRDSAILFVFFTTWCEPCKAEIAHLNSLAKKYATKLEIIGVALEDKSAAELEKFAQDEGINYNIAAGKMNYTFMQVLDGFSGIPYAALYNKNGKNIANYTGIIAEEMLEVDILRAIK